MSEANAWASAHALSMVTWHHHNFVNDYHLIMFTHLFKAESAINDFILRSESSQNYLFFPKGIKEQAGAQRSQAQLKLGLGFTPTNLHQIDEKESFKYLLFTAPNSLLLAITILTLFISSCFSTVLGLKVMGGRLR